LIASDIEPALHVCNLEAEHCDFRASERVPQAYRERPSRASELRLDTENGPAVSLNVRQQLLLALVVL
jgi:hypothetical protein